MTDLHTHILPHMDDGASSTAISLSMLRIEAEQSVTGVALTPHFYVARESTTQFLSRRKAAWERLSERMERESGPFPDLVLGAEVAWAPHMDRMDDMELLCLGRSRYLLLELPFTPWSGSMLDQLYNFVSRSGVTPVLAHLERYLRTQRAEHIQELYRMNVPIQISAGSLLRPIERWRCRGLLRSGRSVLLASDCHNLERRAPNLAPAAAAIKKRMDGGAVGALLDCSDVIFAAARGQQEGQDA